MDRRSRASGGGPLRRWALAVVLISACSVDKGGLGAPDAGPVLAGTAGSAAGGSGGSGTGLGGAAGGVGGTAGAAAGAAGGAGGPAGAGGAGGVVAPIGGAGGECPAGGAGGGVGNGATSGGGGGGSDATGGAASGGAATGGAASGGAGGAAAGAGGTGVAGGAGTGAAGDAGSGAAGVGGSGVAGGAGGAGGEAGGAGAGGRGGAGGGAGCSSCPACTRCLNGACAAEPTSLWKVRCVRAGVAQTKANGDAWDIGTGILAAPDPQCAFWLGNSLAAQTSTLSNTFAPAWNESITPGERFSASLLASQSSPWSIRVTDEDQLGSDAICSVSPALDAAAFLSGSATFAAGSCTTLEIGLECVSQ